jgi:hypothetical protein
MVCQRNALSDVEKKTTSILGQQRLSWRVKCVSKICPIQIVALGSTRYESQKCESASKKVRAEIFH